MNTAVSWLTLKWVHQEEEENCNLGPGLLGTQAGNLLKEGMVSLWRAPVRVPKIPGPRLWLFFFFRYIVSLSVVSTKVRPLLSTKTELSTC
jgi:hypothetical protein